MKLARDKATLLVIDVQQKLMPVIDRADDVLRNIDRLVRGCHLLGVPALLTEQYVKGLGPTVEPTCTNLRLQPRIARWCVDRYAYVW